MTAAVVVTGSGRGIGAAITRRLARDGFYVVGVEFAPDGADVTQADLGAHGEIVEGDCAELATLRHAASRAISDGRPLAGWVNNAAVAERGTLHQLDEAAVDRVLRVNLRAVLLGTAVAVQRFLDQGSGGSVVNVSSIQGQAAFPGWAAYVAAKGGVDALTRYSAVEYGPFGIRTNAVAPGNVRTHLTEGVIGSADDPVAMEALMGNMHPIGRIGEPEEVAAVVAFLLSGESSLVNGQIVAADGGATARCYPMPPAADLVADA